MKISYYEAFDLIAEEAVDLLAEHSESQMFLEDFSVEKTLEDIGTNTESQKVLKKRIPIKIRLLLVAVIVLTLSTVCFAEWYTGAKLINEFNRYLIGKDIVENPVDPLITDAEGNIVQGFESLPSNGEVWKKSSVIKKVKDAMEPSSINEFKTINDDNVFITPEIITWNGDLVIFTKEDGRGWYLEEGQSLIFEVTLYPHETNNNGKGQRVSFYKIYNGTFYGKGYDTGISNEKKYELVADRKGEYYIALKNYSSDSISFHEGHIKILK